MIPIFSSVILSFAKDLYPYKFRFFSAGWRIRMTKTKNEHSRLRRINNYFLTAMKNTERSRDKKMFRQN